MAVWRRNPQCSLRSLLPSAIPLSARMERTFLDRCRRLSTPAQTLMLLAAADDSLHHAELRRAGRALGVGEDAFAQVERSGLLLVDGDFVRVRHPLVRSAIYQAATACERRAAHAALSAALDQGASADGDRRTCHRAAAAEGADDGVAEQLGATAARAESRGGHEAASLAYSLGLPGTDRLVSRLVSSRR